MFNRGRIVLFLSAASVIALAACESTAPTPTAEPIPVTPAGQTAAQAAPTAPTAAPTAPAAAPAKGGLTGKVVETMNSGGYTYVALEKDGGKVWSAGPQIAVKVGDTVSMAAGMPMKNYHSKTLDRTFETVYFVGKITVAGGEPAPAPTSAPAAPAGDAPAAGMGGGERNKAAAVEITGVVKAEGGKTVAEIFAEKAQLSGKEITLRAKVVKYNGGIMGKNWLHVQDGSGAAGSNDLTVTSGDVAEVGKTVLIKGKVATKRDFGAGYSYDLMIEDAKITVE